MELKIYLNDVEYTEPLGIKDLTFRASRDMVTHGVIFEATISELGFIKDARDYLLEQKAIFGFNADVIIRIDYRCDDGEFSEAYKGRLDFRTFREICGTRCIVYMSIEQKGCNMILKNRSNQKVDLDSTTAFDKITLLQNYTGLNKSISLPGVAVDSRVEGYVAEEGEQTTAEIDLTSDTGLQGVLLRPTYGIVNYNSIANGFLDDPSSTYEDASPYAFLLTPQFLFNDTFDCFATGYDYTVRLKGRYSGENPLTVVEFSKAMLKMYSADSSLFTGGFTLAEEDITTTPTIDGVPFSQEFDVSFSGHINSINNSEGIYAFIYLHIDSLASSMELNWEFDPETYFSLIASKRCPATDVNVNMINETGSRIIEAITDGCMRMKSDYYGRTDSEPIASVNDGCGSLRAVTSGLKVRNADNPAFFMSWEEYYLNLKAIDNIGFGIEPDEIVSSREWVRVEPVEYFYKDVKIFDIEGVPLGTKIADLDSVYSVVKTGFAKWEVQKYNGLQEINSNKTFRTSLKTIDRTYEGQSAFIAGSLAWEHTRSQQYTDTGGADTSYDNEPFIICLKRNEGYAYASDMAVETNVIENPSNIFSPSTVYNWRIRPFYNLMRLAKTVFNCYTNLFNSTSKLFFSSGTGNLLAAGELTTGDNCKLENGPKAENRDLAVTDYAEAADYIPIYKPERMTFENYPMSVAQWQLLKANPYGYMNVQCGNGDFVKYYLKEITFKLTAQKANFDLLLKWT